MDRINAVINPHKQIRRRFDSTVDIDFYRQQALAERAAAAFRPDKRRSAGMLIATAIALALAGTLVIGSLAVAGVIHIVKAALWRAA